MANPLTALRRVCVVEAVSYFVLLTVAMPLKYSCSLLWPVRVFGMVHGLLFLLMIWLLLRARLERAWPVSRLWLLFAASLLPLVPFWLDARVAQWVRDSAP